MTLKVCQRNGMVQKGRKVPKQLGKKAMKNVFKEEKRWEKQFWGNVKGQIRLCMISTGVKKASIVLSRSIHYVMAKGQPRRTWVHQAESWRGKQRKNYYFPFLLRLSDWIMCAPVFSMSDVAYNRVLDLTGSSRWYFDAVAETKGHPV